MTVLSSMVVCMFVIVVAGGGANVNVGKVEKEILPNGQPKNKPWSTFFTSVFLGATAAFGSGRLLPDSLPVFDFSDFFCKIRFRDEYLSHDNQTTNLLLLLTAAAEEDEAQNEK